MTKLRILACVSLVFAAFIFVFSLSGCQGQSNNNLNIDQQQPLDRRIGLLKSLGGVRTSNSGTNLLQLDDGSTILLKSVALNLDDPVYLDKTVEVRGVVTYTTDGKQLMEVMNIDLVDANASQETTQAQWKDYSNQTLGVAMKYSDVLSVHEDVNNVSFERKIEPVGTTEQTGETVSQESATIHKLTISSEKKTAGKTLAAKLGLTGTDTVNLAAKGMAESKIGSGNYDAIKKVDGSVIYYYVDNGGYIYTIAIDCGQDEQTLGDQNMFYEMIGTLQIGEIAQNGSQEQDRVNNAATQAVNPDAPVTAVKTDGPKTSDEPVVVKTPAAAVEADDKVTEPDVSADSSTESSESATQEAMDGFSKMESTAYNFTVQYPKSWYYSGAASSESGVIRHYEFGTKPLDETPGQISMDLISGSVPSGTSSTVNGKTVVTTTSGGTVEVYVKGSGSRVYKFTGPAGTQSTLLDMAGSIE